MCKPYIQYILYQLPFILVLIPLPKMDWIGVPKPVRDGILPISNKNHHRTHKMYRNVLYICWQTLLIHHLRGLKMLHILVLKYEVQRTCAKTAYNVHSGFSVSEPSLNNEIKVENHGWAQYKATKGQLKILLHTYCLPVGPPPLQANYGIGRPRRVGGTRRGSLYP